MELQCFINLADKKIERLQKRKNPCRKNETFKLEVESVASFCEEYTTLRGKNFANITDVTKVRKRGKTVKVEFFSHTYVLVASDDRKGVLK